MAQVRAYSVPLALLVVTMVLVPLVMLPMAMDPALTPRSLVLALFSIALILVKWKQRQLRPLPLLGKIWIGYFLVMAASIVVAINSSEARWAVAILSVYTAWFFACIQTIRRENLESICRAGTIVVLVVSIIGICQNFNLGFLWIPGAPIPYGTMTTKNLLSGWLLIALFLPLRTLFIERGKWQFAALVTITFSSFLIVAAQTRAVWLAVIAAGFSGAIILLSSATRREVMRSVMKPLAGLAMVIVVVASATYLLPNSQKYTVSASTSTSTTSYKVSTLVNYAKDTSSQMRLTVWKKSLTMIEDHPALGVGAGNWKIVLPNYGLSEFPPYIQNASNQWTHPHNDFVSVFAEGGLLAGLFYIGFLAMALGRCLQRARSSKRVEDVILFALLGSTIVGYCVLSAFDFPKERIEHSMYMLLIVAIITALTRGPADNIRASQKKLRMLSGAFIAIALFGLLGASLRLDSEIHQKHYLDARAVHNWPLEIEESDLAYSNMFGTLDQLSTPVLYYKAEAEYMQNKDKLALADNLRALEAHPNQINVLNNTGSSYERIGNHVSAEAYYKRALAISPRYEEVLLNLTATYFNEGEYPLALSTLLRCDTSVPDSRAWRFLKVVREKLP